MNNMLIVFSSPNLEKSPSSKPVEFQLYHEEEADSDLEESEEDTAAIEKLLHKLYDQAFRYSRDPRPWFEDFDKQNRGYVTKRQFRSVLANSGLPISSSDLDLLFRRFHRDSKLMMRYKKFCLDMQQYGHERLLKGDIDKQNEDEPSLIQASKPSGTASKTLPPDLEQTLCRIQTQVFQRRVRIEDFFGDYDKLRLGVVSDGIFRRVLDIHGIKLSDAEFQLLLRNYGNPVRYANFIEDVLAVFVAKNLEKDPHMSTKPFILYDEDRLRNDLDESEDETKIIDKVLDDIANRVLQRGLNLKPYLEDFDRNHDGSITKPQFHSVILNLVQRITTQQCDLLQKRFHRGANLNYVQFVEEVEKLATIKGGKVQPRSTTPLKKILSEEKKPQLHEVSLERIMHRVQVTAF